MGSNTKEESTRSIGDESWTSLGQCHFGDEEEEATTLAVKSDGEGWISVCDEHKGAASEAGFEPEQ